MLRKNDYPPERQKLFSFNALEVPSHGNVVAGLHIVGGQNGSISGGLVARENYFNRIRAFGRGAVVADYQR
jgi:hypothetical protein